MARKIITLLSLAPEAGITWTQEDYRLTAADIANGQMFLNNGNTFLFVSNPAATLIPPADTTDVIISAVPDNAGRTNAAGVTGDPTYATGYKITMQPSTSRFFGPFRPAWWNQTANDVGYVYVNISRLAVAVYGVKL